MDPTPRPKLDRLALTVFGLAVVVLVGGAGAFALFLVNQPDAPAPVAKPPAPLPPFEGRTFRYAVTVEPPAWRDITLTYRLLREGGDPVAYTEFVHAGGSARFRLGRLEPGDPAHANVRFPGFFLHHAYLRPPFEKGRTVDWSWAWQPAREGRVKEFRAVMRDWEQVEVPHGRHRAMRVEVTIRYLEQGKQRGQTRETVWFAPELGIVKVLREGAAPDEASRRIVAELAEVK